MSTVEIYNRSVTQPIYLKSSTNVFVKNINVDRPPDSKTMNNELQVMGNERLPQYPSADLKRLFCNKRKTS
jgi:hypothetical protein